MQIWQIFCMQKICKICISVCSSDVPKKKEMVFFYKFIFGNVSH